MCLYLCVGKMPFKVVVLGAGVSGLMAARQLSYFGLEVIVVEARVSWHTLVSLLDTRLLSPVGSYWWACSYLS